MKESDLVFYEVHCPECGQFRGSFPYVRRRKECPQCGNQQAITMFAKEFNDTAKNLRTTPDGLTEARTRYREFTGSYLKPEQPIIRRKNK